VSVIIYEFFPVLNGLQISQAPQIVSSLAAGLFIFVVGIPFTPQIARLCGPTLGEMENQMKMRQRNPNKVKIE
jgi:hypothetical protein